MKLFTQHETHVSTDSEGEVNPRLHMNRHVFQVLISQLIRAKKRILGHARRPDAGFQASGMFRSASTRILNALSLVAQASPVPGDERRSLRRA